MNPSSSFDNVQEENSETDSDGIDQATEKQTGNVIPKKGFVNQVCREWLVHEDSALAYRLQRKEIELHYDKNRSERQTVMSDIQRAKCLQEEDDSDSALNLKDFSQYLHLQELEDEQIAKQLQEQMECEEALHNRILEQADQEMARKLQDSEKTHHPHHSKRKAKNFNGVMPSNKQDLASCYEDTLSRATKNWSLENGSTRQRDDDSTSPSDNLPSPSAIDRVLQTAQLSNKCCSPLEEKDLQIYQELKDEELALSLHREESQKTSQYFKDQQLAIEYQDRELAKLLQEKERLRAKKLRHKHKAAAAAASQNASSGDGYERSTKSQGTDPVDKTFSSGQPFPVTALAMRDDVRNRSRREEPETLRGSGHPASAAHYPLKSYAGTEKSPGSRVAPEGSGIERCRGEDLSCIGLPLDTAGYDYYQQPSLELRSPPSQSGNYNFRDVGQTGTTAHNDSSDEYSDEQGVPPYMPIQGQKRQPQDKRKKKDGCRQQ